MPLFASYFRQSCLLMILLLCRQAVHCQLIADFSTDKTGGCSPLAIQFTNHSSGASANAVYTWDFGNGNSSFLLNPGAIYTDEQTYRITLTIQDGSRSSAKTKEITVYRKPTVDFNFSTTKGCLPLAVNFTSTSASGDGNISGYTWDFGDGSTQTGYSSSQTHTYNTAQTISASLTVTNNYGCHTTLQKKQIISVIPSLNAVFSADKKVLCLASDPVHFTNSSSGPGTLNYLWDFGDGNSSTQSDPDYAFNKKGIYSVKLTVKSSEGCTAVKQEADYLNVASYKADFDGPESICQNNYAVFNIGSSPAPDATIWQVDGVQIYSYNNLSYWFNTPGEHTVTLNNSFGSCTQSISKNITVKESPAITGIDATATAKCNGITSYQFADHTAGAVKWEWDFNHRYDPPNISSNLQSPVYTFEPGGFYPVLLRVTNAAGCSSNFTRNIATPVYYVNIVTTGNAGLTSCEDPLTETFAANTNQVLTAYEWNFGDGESSTEASPTHTYTKPGRYTVSLQYTTQEGCTGRVSNPGYISIYPKVDYDFAASATTVCGTTQILFNASPDNPDVINWSWDFGDNAGYGPSGPNYYHSYSQAGTYTVKLYIWGVCQAVVTKENYITVVDLFAKISNISNSCEGTHGEVSFTQTARNAVSLTWNFGDGSTLTTGPDQLTVKHIYKQTGSYNVTLTASNNQCSQTDYNKAYVLLKQKPVLTASASIVCPNEPVPVDVSGLAYNPQPFPYSNPYNIVLRYADGTPFDGSTSGYWNYGGNEYNGSIYNFNRSDETVQAIAISSYFNCSDSSNFVTVKVKSAGATAGFEVHGNNSCYTSPVEFKDISQTAAGVLIQSWLWDFGDGQTNFLNTGGTVSHTYKSPGIYYASLKITDASGCSSATPGYAQYVSVAGPLAAFSTSGVNVPLNSSIYFYNNSNNNGSPGTVYSWDFGDQSAISHDFSPVHTYPVAGTYTITLTATNPLISCSSTAQQVIAVKNFNTAFGFTSSYIAGSCPPVLVSFRNTSVNYTRVTWDFGDGITADNLNFPSHVYERPGKYIVTLHVYAPNGLSDDYIDSIFVRSPAAAVTVSPPEVCIGSTVSLSAKADNTSAYIWDYGDGNIGATTVGSTDHQYLSSGNFQTKLMLQDDAGCYGKAGPASPVTVRANPVVGLSPEDPLVCLGSSVTLHASGGANYLWTPATGLSDDKVADPLASPVVSSDYSIRVTDDFGCTNTRTLAVEVVQPLSLQVNADTAVCAGDPVPLKATGEEIYQWIETTEGLSNTTIPDPVALPPASMVYTVTGSDKHNCFSQTASVHIRVMPLPLVNAGGDAEIWSGETTQLNGTGSTDVIQWNWQPEKYLSCYDCLSPVCTPLTETNYVLTAKNQDGCVARDTVFVKIDCAASHVFIPNIFTPNRDGINDLFMIKGIAIIKHMVIYGRWGERVFERSNFIAGDRASCWNGTFKGLDAPSGSYVYFIEMECPTGGLFTRRGSVVLVR